jgi:hypothetical protein
VSRRENVGPTADPKVQGAKDAKAKDAAKQLRRDVVKLLAVPEFRRYVAHVVYGKLGLKRDPWRLNAGETARAAARAGVAAELLAELGGLDPQGFILLEQEHVNRMAAELELPATTEEQDDA